MVSDNSDAFFLADTIFSLQISASLCILCIHNFNFLYVFLYLNCTVYFCTFMHPLAPLRNNYLFTCLLLPFMILHLSLSIYIHLLLPSSFFHPFIVSPFSVINCRSEGDFSSGLVCVGESTGLSLQNFHHYTLVSRTNDASLPATLSMLR